MPGNLANSLTAVSSRADENCMYKITKLYPLHCPSWHAQKPYFSWAPRSPAAGVYNNRRDPRHRSDLCRKEYATGNPRAQKAGYYTGAMVRFYRINKVYHPG